MTYPTFQPPPQQPQQPYGYPPQQQTPQPQPQPYGYPPQQAPQQPTYSGPGLPPPPPTDGGNIKLSEHVGDLVWIMVRNYDPDWVGTNGARPAIFLDIEVLAGRSQVGERITDSLHTNNRLVGQLSNQLGREFFGRIAGLPTTKGNPAIYLAPPQPGDEVVIQAFLARRQQGHGQGAATSTPQPAQQPTVAPAQAPGGQYTQPPAQPVSAPYGQGNPWAYPPVLDAPLPGDYAPNGNVAPQQAPTPTPAGMAPPVNPGMAPPVNPAQYDPPPF